MGESESGVHEFEPQTWLWTCGRSGCGLREDASCHTKPAAESGVAGAVELLPCPHCGSSAIQESRSDGWVVYCRNRMNPDGLCPVNSRTRTGMSQAQSTALWNTRASVAETADAKIEAETVSYSKVYSELIHLAAQIVRCRTYDENDPWDVKMCEWASEIRELADMISANIRREAESEDS